MSAQYAGRFYDALFDTSSKLLKQTQYIVTTDEAGLTQATLYTDRTRDTTTSAILTTDNAGMAEFYADPGPGVYYYIFIAGTLHRKIEVKEDVADTVDTDTFTAHTTATTSVHGIANTANLETQSGAQSKANSARDTAQGYADTQISTHNSDTTSVHGIADTSVLETQSGAQTKANAAQAASQPVNAKLTTISALSPANDDFLQWKSGALTNRTVAQVKADLGITSITGQYLGSASSFAALPVVDPAGNAASNGDWAVLNADDGGNQRGIYIYDGAAFSLALSISADGALIAANNLSDLASASTARANLGIGNVDNTSDVNKPISTATQTALDARRNRYNDQGAAKTASYSMSVWDRATFDTTAGAISQALPASPVVGDEVQVHLVAGTNALTLTHASGNFSITVAGHGVTALWTGSAWVETQDRKTQSSLDARYQLKANRKVFDPFDYGYVGDGFTDDTVAVQNTVYAAVAWANSANRTAVIDFPAGGITLLDHASQTSINWDGTNVGQVVFRGNRSTVKCGRNSRIFVHYSGTNGSAVVGNIIIEDFLFDNNNTTKTWGQNGLIFNLDCAPSLIGGFKNLLIQRCEVRNMPRPSGTGDPFQICVNLELYVSNDTDRQKSVIFDGVTVQDCVFGKIGYGGSYGVRYQSLHTSTAYGTTTWDRARNPQYENNHQFNNTTLRRIYHNGGPPSQTYYANSNFMLGSQAHGDHLVCEDLICDNSGDDGLEINSFTNVLVNRCRFSNSQTGANILLNNLGGMPNPQNQRIRITNCHFGPTSGSNGDSGLFIRYVQGAPHGNITVEGCHFYDGYVRAIGAYKSLILRNLTFTYTRGWANGGFTDVAPIYLEQHAGRGSIIVEDATASFDTTWNNPSNVSNSYLLLGVIKVNWLSDCRLLFKNIVLVNNITGLTNVYGNGPRISPISLSSTNAAYTASFDGTNNGNFWYDAGTSADVTVNSGVLKPSGTATLTNEVRAAALHANADYWNHAVGPQTDINVQAKFTPGTTVTGFKGGIVGKAVSATTYTEGYLYDDGTTSFLCLDKVIAGVRTSLLGTITNGGAGTVTGTTSPPSNVSDRGIALASRIAASTAAFVRFRQQGKKVQVDYNTVAIGLSTSAQIATASATFSSQGDIQKFVESQAISGWVWVPIDATTTMDDFIYYRMATINGSIENVFLEHLSKTDIGYIQMITNGLSTSLARFTSPMRIINCSLNRHLGITGTVTDFTPMNDIGAWIYRQNIRSQDGSVNSLTAPGSATAYTNVSGYKEQVFWYGGTLTTPFVELSLDGGTTWSQIRGANAEGSVSLLPGDQIRWTYSSAPTFKRAAIS